MVLSLRGALWITLRWQCGHFGVQAVILQNASPFGLPDCFPYNEFQVRGISFHSLTSGSVSPRSPAMAPISSQLSPAGGPACAARAPGLPNKAALCSFPARALATALPAPWAQSLRAISGPFVVDLAWENLRSRLLHTTACLRGLKVIPWAWLLRSVAYLGLCF